MSRHLVEINSTCKLVEMTNGKTIIMIGFDGNINLPC